MSKNVLKLTISMKKKYSTLQQALLELASENSQGITFVNGTDEENFLTYGDLYQDALCLLGAMQRKGLLKGSEVIIQADSNRTFVYMFWACVLGGAIPVPIDIAGSSQVKDKVLNVVKTLSNPYVFIENDTKYGINEFLVNNLSSNEYSSEQGLMFEILIKEKIEGQIVPVDASDTAFIQFSSGSTGLPKGIVLSNKNVTTNIYDIIISSNSEHEENIMVSWIPLTHDMGLIGMHLCTVFLNSPLININTQVFIRNPLIWLNKMSEHKATVSQSPNFGFSYVLDSFREDEEYDWKFDRLRLIFNGAEPISTAIADRFLEQLEKYGLKKSVMFTVYGIAESTLAVAFPIPCSPYTKMVIDRQHLNIKDNVIEVEESDPNAVEFVSVGKGVGNNILTLVDKDGKELGDGQVGNILIKGESVTSGYYGIENNETLFNENGALITGDIGFLKNGNLYITGREKELIIVNGQNFYPHDIEENLSRLVNYPLGRIVAGSTVTNAGERTLIFVQFRKK